MIQRIINAIRYIRTKGLARFVRYGFFRISEQAMEWTLGIDTAGITELKLLGLDNPESVGYMPIGYNALRRGFGLLAIEPGKSVLLDYGSGKGRILAYASRMPFKRVVGVEFAKELNEAAKANLARVRGQRCSDWQCIHVDATTFVIPEDVDVITSYNPFRGKTLTRVIENVRASLWRRPRRIAILYFNNDDFERQTVNLDWIRNVRQEWVYPNFKFGFYEVSIEAIEKHQAC